MILGSRRGRWLVITRGVDRVCDPWLQEREVAGNHPGSGQGVCFLAPGEGGGCPSKAHHTLSQITVH